VKEGGVSMKFLSVFFKAVSTVNPVTASILAGITWILFPEQSFIPWCIALWIAMVLDLFTRWFAIFIKAKGMVRAIKTKAWNSEDMFRKTAIKIVSYLTIQLLAGLSMRFVGIPIICNVVATVIYSFLFFREFASNVENLIEAGADYLKPLLFWVKKKQDETLEKQEKEESDIEQI